MVVGSALLNRPVRADGLPPPQAYPPPQPSQSCLMTALQLGYQTGRREVAYAATEACMLFAGSRGAVAQPVTSKRAAARLAARAANGRRDADTMGWFFLEALVALLIAVGIVAWTMGPKRRKPPRVTAGDADRDKKAR